MNIGIDARMYGARATTGIGFYIQQLIAQLAVLDQKNHYTLFMRTDGLKQLDLVQPRFNPVVADIPWYSYGEQVRLPRLLRAQRLDVVHFPHFNVPIAYRRPYVVTIHDITPMFFPGPRVKQSPLRRQAYRLILSNGLRQARHIIAISQHTKRQLVTYAGVAAERITVIYPGLNQRCRPITDKIKISALRQRYGITKPYLLYVGVWRDHKNLPGLIAAFNQLKAGGEHDLQLVLAGTADPRYPEIQAAIDQSPVRTDVITPGYVDDDDLATLYSAAKIFVLPSFAEGFGLVAIEAAACGTPVVGSNTTSVSEILGGAGRYFNPYEPGAIAAVLHRVLTSSAESQAMQQQGIAAAQRYQWRICAEQTLAVYQKAIKN